jgi:hypothetical protein
MKNGSQTRRRKRARRVFEGVLLPPNETGRATWICEDENDATKWSDDEAWFGWAEHKKVRITIERCP